MSTIIAIILSFLYAINGAFSTDRVLYLQQNNTITEARYDNHNGYIDIYYYFIGTPSSEGLAIQIIRNGQHQVTHNMSNKDIYINKTNTNQTSQGNLYKYRFQVNNIQHTDVWTIKIINNSGKTISYVGTIGTYITYTIEGYEGYYEGYQQGVVDGIESGYNQGYQQGIDDYQNRVEETENTIDRIWAIIQNSVNVVLNVFSFPILPGIPLYMLISLPILIAILLFIIKALAK